LTYRFVENPVRHATSPWTFKPAIVGAVALCASAAIVAGTFLVPQQSGKQEANVDLAANMLSEPVSPETAGAVAELPFNPSWLRLRQGIMYRRDRPLSPASLLFRAAAKLAERMHFQA
jgi:hypothetical protein